MSDLSTDRQRAAHGAYYDRAADAFRSSPCSTTGSAASPRTASSRANEPEFYCLRLYEHTVRDTPLAARDVLEVSCGRGGGAIFVEPHVQAAALRRRRPEPENVRLARDACRAQVSTFAIGNAERLDFADASFDVVINIEASHLYDDRTGSSRRCCACCSPAAISATPTAAGPTTTAPRTCSTAGFELLERLEITSNVLHALRKDSARRTALFDAMKNRDLREEYKHWGGVVGYRAYNRFEAGQTRYFSHRLRRPG